MAQTDELKSLLRSLSPSISDGKYCMGTFDEAQMMGLAGYIKYIVGIFRENEGLTAVFSDEIMEEMALYTSAKIAGPFALITLGVVSPLASVGLLAAITGALAKEGVPVNAYSAFYHDHLLVPYDKREAALSALKKLQKIA